MAVRNTAGRPMARAKVQTVPGEGSGKNIQLNKNNKKILLSQKRNFFQHDWNVGFP